MRTPKLLCAIFLLGPIVSPADEGIWLLNRFPVKRVQEKYRFQVTDDFLKRIQAASIRMNNGGSASFVSPRGLIFTNHHVASECVQQLSDADNDYLNNGFLAATEADEKTCPGLEINVLLEIQDVTAKVNAPVTAGMEAAEANRARKAAMTEVEKACSESTGNRCDVVTLYSGGVYHLYRYKKYTDVRLVFAPEVAVASFGGDPDNFTYPRYCLDFAFLRAYENKEPAATPTYLAWSRAGVRENELVFVAGHPGSTGRMATVAELGFLRDISYPFVIGRLAESIAALHTFGGASPENRRMAQDLLFSLQNSFKAYSGFLSGLRSRTLLQLKQAEEKKLRDAVAADPARQKLYGGTWDEVATAYAEYSRFYQEYNLLERSPAYGVDLFALARRVLRYGVEKQKPNDQRLREYVDPALPSLEQAMFSDTPIHPTMEAAMLAVYLAQVQWQFGEQDPLIRQILAGRTPQQAAEAIIKTTRLADASERKRLANDPKAAAESDDGMLKLVRDMEVRSRALRLRYEDTLEAVMATSAARIAQARFAISGSDDYPDATFTLRLSYGPVTGYRTGNDRVAYSTDFNGLYRRATGQEPYALPERWLKSKGSLRMNTPLNFISTADTHGGNSGSPTINRQGEVVGILFDGNLQSLPNRFVYRDEQERSIHVAGQAIVEALQNVYQAKRVLTELGIQ